MPRCGQGRESFLVENSSDNMEKINLKKSLDFMRAELTRLASQRELLIGLAKEVGRLKIAIPDRYRKTAEQEQKRMIWNNTLEDMI